MKNNLYEEGIQMENSLLVKVQPGGLYHQLAVQI